MIGSSYKCIELISEARRLYDLGRYPECLAIIEGVRRCSLQCSEGEACSAALRIVSKGMMLTDMAACSTT
ncbi:MAG: hypothetical protein EPN20_06100 [Magnetospirillum sp.]|nr:MAG: hypothetical protein EPN20_06100 [Magnetospirillum sp.]